MFWYQLKVVALDLFDAMFRTAQKAPEKSPSLSFEKYIEESRLCHKDFAFVEQIKTKQINKSVEWGSSRNIHGQGAMRRLLYHTRLIFSRRSVSLLPRTQSSLPGVRLEIQITCL